MSQSTQIETYEDEIELKTLITMLWDFRLFILRVTVVFGLLALGLSAVSYVLANPTVYYEAESVVNVNIDESVPRQKQAYLSVLSSEASINAATANLELAHAFSATDVTISEVKDTSLIKVTVKYPNANDAQVITDAIVNQSIMVAADVLNGVSVNSREMATLTGNNTTTKEASNFILNIMIGLVLGGMLSVFVVFFMEYWIGKVKTIDDIEKGLHVEVLTTLVNTNSTKKQGWWPWKQ